jgi:hypothetical protein
VIRGRISSALNLDEVGDSDGKLARVPDHQGCCAVRTSNLWRRPFHVQLVARSPSGATEGRRKDSTAIPTDGRGRLGPCYACIEATNVGHRVVNVTGIHFQLEDGRNLVQMINENPPGFRDTQLPATLSDGESAKVYMAYRDLAAAFQDSHCSTKVFPVRNDSAGGVHKGKPWVANPLKTCGHVTSGNCPVDVPRYKA